MGALQIAIKEALLKDAILTYKTVTYLSYIWEACLNTIQNKACFDLNKNKTKNIPKLQG